MIRALVEAIREAPLAFAGLALLAGLALGNALTEVYVDARNRRRRPEGEKR